MELPQHITRRRTLLEEKLEILIMNYDNFGLLTTWIGEFRGSHSDGADDSCPLGMTLSRWPGVVITVRSKNRCAFYCSTLKT